MMIILHNFSIGELAMEGTKRKLTHHFGDPLDRHPGIIVMVNYELLHASGSHYFKYAS